eukprot:6231608-Alexandrium_andersonii.AAC.1
MAVAVQQFQVRASRPPRSVVQMFMCRLDIDSGVPGYGHALLNHACHARLRTKAASEERNV